jgi:hypothetical protein
MKEIILNIYLVINDGLITEFRAAKYEVSGSDEEKITFLKSKAEFDFHQAEVFDVPIDKNGQKMSYKKFYKLEKQGFQFQLFEHIFDYFNAPENPLVCVTPVLDGKILAENVSN